MLTRTAASEVIAGQEDVCRVSFRLVEDEIRFGLAAGIVSPVEEKLIAQASLRDGFQKTSRDDLIGVDVVDG